MVFVECLVPVDDIIPCPLQTAVCLVITLTPSIIIGHRHLNIWRGGGTIKSVSRIGGVFITHVITLTIVNVVGRESGLEVETLHEIKLEIEVAKCTPCLTFLGRVLELHKGVEGIGKLVTGCGCTQGKGITREVGHLAFLMPHAILVGLVLQIIGHHVRVHAVGILYGSIVGIFIFLTSHIEIESHSDQLVDFSIQAALEIDTILLVCLVDSVNLIVTQTYMVVDFVA